jgi:hypothetical protein
MAADGKSDGPLTEEKFRQLIAEGRVAPATLVWADGMTDWQRADQVPGLLATAPPAVRTPGSAPPTVPLGQGHTLSAEFPVWGLFWRSIVVAIGSTLVIPVPWVIAWYYRWLIERVQVPGRADLSFAGKAGDIWYIIALQALVICLQFLPMSHGAAVQFAGFIAMIVVSLLLEWIVIRWVVRNITSAGQPLPLTFVGSYWGLLGWAALTYLSMLTVIGWAWVVTATGRWLCRNVQGSRRPITFEASGWGVLWRSVLFILASCFVIPIPWMLRWYLRWIVSQVSLGGRGV